MARHSAPLKRLPFQEKMAPAGLVSVAMVSVAVPMVLAQMWLAGAAWVIARRGRLGRGRRAARGAGGGALGQAAELDQQLLGQAGGEGRPSG